MIFTAAFLELCVALFGFEIVLSSCNIHICIKSPPLYGRVFPVMSHRGLVFTYNLA